jgi:hypothetical protein
MGADEKTAAGREGIPQDALDLDLEFRVCLDGCKVCVKFL